MGRRTPNLSRGGTGDEFVATASQKVLSAAWMGPEATTATTDSKDRANRRRNNEERHQLFVDPEEMKRVVRENLMKPTYDVSMYYHEDGLWRGIATNPTFEKVALGVIAFNALWIGVDTEYNMAETLLNADVIFQVADHGFCVFFAFEWFSRFMAFRRKLDCFRDGWFLFDSFLVSTMVSETWVLTAILLWSGTGASSIIRNASILRIVRLARLTRMARIARVLRSMPELMILLKGMAAATRSVFTTLSLLCLTMYVFAIAFTQLAADDSYISTKFFAKVPDSMYTLLVYGVLLDGLGDVITALVSESTFLLVLFLLFVLIGQMTLMNMLIGVLTEVVSAVAATEKEALMVMLVKEKMQGVLEGIDSDGDGAISKQEFGEILGNKEATRTLSEVGVDVMGLVDFADFIFTEVGGGEDACLDFGKFMDVVLQFRGTNKATVKDVVNLQKYLTNALATQLEEIRGLKQSLLVKAQAYRTLLDARDGHTAKPTKSLDGVRASPSPSVASQRRRRREEERPLLTTPPRDKAVSEFETPGWLPLQPSLWTGGSAESLELEPDCGDRDGAVRLRHAADPEGLVERRAPADEMLLAPLVVVRPGPPPRVLEPASLLSSPPPSQEATEGPTSAPQRRRPSLGGGGGGGGPPLPPLVSPAPTAASPSDAVSEVPPSSQQGSEETSVDGERRAQLPRRNSHTHLFVDAEEMKRKVRENLSKPTYDVSMYYHREGIWRDIATSAVFQNVTLGVIAVNALWIGIDTEYNSADEAIHASVLFQLADHAFCLFFAFEWFSRFMSFRHKRDCLRDAWFVFDSFLAGTMVIETWVISSILLFSGQGQGGFLRNASILRVARLARLSRMARMARLLRAMPELMILLKGLAAATRSVCFTLLLLCIIMYIFAIAFTQLCSGDAYIRDKYFGSVPESMYSLLIYGLMLDGIGAPAFDLAAHSYLLLALFLLFILLGNLTMLNMLIGLLTQVVSAVAATEKESLTVMFVKNKMQHVLQGIDRNSDGCISKEEFCEILSNREATRALFEVGVDVIGLVDFADFIFAAETEEGKDTSLDFNKFMQVILQFRGTNKATVKDMVNLRKFVSNSLHGQLEDVQSLQVEMVMSPSIRGRISRRSSNGDSVDSMSRRHSSDGSAPSKEAPHGHSDEQALSMAEVEAAARKLQELVSGTWPAPVEEVPTPPATALCWRPATDGPLELPAAAAPQPPQRAADAPGRAPSPPPSPSAPQSQPPADDPPAVSDRPRCAASGIPQTSLQWKATAADGPRAPPPAPRTESRTGSSLPPTSLWAGRAAADPPPPPPPPPPLPLWASPGATDASVPGLATLTRGSLSVPPPPKGPPPPSFRTMAPPAPTNGPAPPATPQPPPPTWVPLPPALCATPLAAPVAAANEPERF